MSHKVGKNLPDVAAAALGKKGAIVTKDVQRVEGNKNGKHVKAHDVTVWNCDAKGACVDGNGKKSSISKVTDGLLSTPGKGQPADLKKMSQDGTLTSSLPKTPGNFIRIGSGAYFNQNGSLGVEVEKSRTYLSEKPGDTTGINYNFKKK